MQALNTLATSPPIKEYGFIKNEEMNTEALISIEIQIITGPRPMQIANIQFNNLDIIGKR